MQGMKFKIKKLLKERGSMTAKEIAKVIGCSKHEVNSFIYYCDDFEKDSSCVPLWHIKETLHDDIITELDPVMLKLQNRENARKFSQEEFDDLADWEYGKAYIGHLQYKTRKGNVIECDSKSEIALLEYLEKNNLVQDIGGQVLQIKYNTAFRSGCSYQPDIVALTQNGHIVVFEVKSSSAMDKHINIEKYRSLAQYCNENGYMYAMLDPTKDFMSFEELRDMSVCKGLCEMFEELDSRPHTNKKPYKYFDDSDVKKWYQEYGGDWTMDEFKLHVHSLVIYYDWYNISRYGFRVYIRPVKLRKNNDGSYFVVDYV